MLTFEKLDVDLKMMFLSKKFSFLFGGIPHLNMHVGVWYCTDGCTGVVVYILFF
jgi:hypothetical protein